MNRWWLVIGVGMVWMSSILGQNLPEKWATKVGITSFKTTIQLEDGSIVLGSNGDARQGLNDPSDGVYWIEAKSGAITRRQVIPSHDDLDVNGIAIAGKRLFAANHAGSVIAYSSVGAGDMVWRTTLDAGIKGAVGVEDFNSDGTPDVVVGTLKGEVVALNGRDGTRLWSAQVDYKSSLFGATERSFIASPALVDLNGDGTRDVILGSRNGSIYAFSGRDGAVIWETRTMTPSGVHASAFVTSQSIIIAESYSKVHWLDYQGTIIRTVNLSRDGSVQGLFSSPAAFPNGTVVIGSSWPNSDNGIWVIPSANGSVPMFLPAGKVSATAVIGDGLGIGCLQAFVVTEAGKLWVINDQGHVIATYDLASGSETTPLMADCDGDGQLELIVTGADKWIRALQLPGRGPVVWPNFRGNRFNTGVIDDDLGFYRPKRKAWISRPWDPDMTVDEFAKREVHYLTTGFDSEEALISPEGIGYARLGTTWGRLKHFLGPDTEFIEGRFGLGYRGVSVVKENEEQFVVLFPEWKRHPIDSDPVLVMLTYNRKYRTKEGVGPGTPLSVIQTLFGKPKLTYDTKTKQESVFFKTMPWNKIRFGLIPITGEYPGAGSVRSSGEYPDGSFVNYIEIRLN